MSKPLDRWMPTYIADYLADTWHLSCEQHGAYLLLLFCLWRRGVLPDDDTFLAATCRVDLDVWRDRIAPMVRPFFQATAGGLTQKRLESERKRAERVIEARRRAGKRGGRPAKQTESNCFSDAKQTPVQVQGTGTEKEEGTESYLNPGESLEREESDASRASFAAQTPPRAAPSRPSRSHAKARSNGGNAQADLLPGASVVQLHRDDPQAAFDAWNAAVAAMRAKGPTGLLGASGLPPARRAKIKKRLTECGGLEGWDAAIQRICGSAWINSAQCHGFGLHHLLQAETFARLMDGVYDKVRLSKQEAAKASEDAEWDRLRADTEAVYQATLARKGL